MSQLSRTNFESKYGTSGSDFPDNTTGLITEAIMRAFGKDISDSFLSSVNDIQRKSTVSGTDTYTVTGGITAYSDGFTIIAKFTNASSGVSTLNVNSIGAKKIYINPTTQATTGHIVANQIYLLVYDSALDAAAGGFAMIGVSTDSGGTVESVVAGAGVSVDATDPANPVVAADVVSVHGRTGAVVAVNGDYDAINITASPAGPLAGTNVQQQLNELGGFITGLSWKESVRVATTTAGTLSTDFALGDTVDGVVLATGDRILIKNQSTQSENGIYRVNSAGSPTRTTDADSTADIENATVSVEAGTTNANTTWVQTTDAPTIGSSNIVFTQFGTSVPAASETTAGISEFATAAETLTGTDNTRSTHPAGVRATYPVGLAAVDTTGTAISFAVPQIYGSDGSPESGNITLVTTGLVKGMVQVLYHDNGTEPTYPSEFVKLSGTYSTTVLNIIYMHAISTARIEYTISQEQ